MPKLNYDLLRHHVAEAREELQDIEKELQAAAKPDEHALQVWFDHAFHHLNFAWNARRATKNQFGNLTGENFNRWSKLPRDINVTKVDVRPPKGGKRRVTSRGRKTSAKRRA
jgi:hypothetical protein